MSNCLVVERDPILGLELEDACAANGYEAVGSFQTCRAAFNWLEEHTPDLAVIGFEAADGPCADLAAELDRRNVPLIVYTAHKHAAADQQEFASAFYLPSRFCLKNLRRSSKWRQDNRALFGWPTCWLHPAK